MKTPTRRGSWRNVAPGQYVKNIGTYADVKFGATARVSFVPFPTCEIIDANGVHVAIPTPADAKKFIAAAKKVYSKDTKAATAKATLPRETPPSKLPKWKTTSLPFVTGELLSDLPSRESMRVEQKLASTDAARRKKASAMWMSGKEPGTQRDIYLRLYAADSKKYRQ
jgi:hypothetical protein